MFLVKRLYEHSFHEWKLIPFHLINPTITIEFKFHLSVALSFQLNQSTVPSIMLSEFFFFFFN